MGKPFSEELDAFAATYKWAGQQDAARLTHFLTRWSGDHAVVVAKMARDSNALRAFSFQMDWVKDGYLATNSLLATVLLLYRAFFGDRDFKHGVGLLFDQDRLTARRASFRMKRLRGAKAKFARTPSSVLGRVRLTLQSAGEATEIRLDRGGSLGHRR